MDLVTFTEKILSGKFRFFVQCEKSKKNKYKINVVLKESEKKTRKKDIKIDICFIYLRIRSWEHYAIAF